jgi:hypothetical protein
VFPEESKPEFASNSITRNKRGVNKHDEHFSRKETLTSRSTSEAYVLF